VISLESVYHQVTSIQSFVSQSVVAAMKSTIIITLLSSLAHAHSGVWNLEIDGLRYIVMLKTSVRIMLTIFCSYPARDARMDGKLGAKRIEWSFSDSGILWGPVDKVDDPALTCKRDQRLSILSPRLT
jgi:hypothetical protein